MIKTIIVEDNVEINQLLKECLEKEGHQCTQAFSGSEALLCLQTGSYDIMLLDLMLPGVTGEAILKQAKEQYLSTSIIVISAKDSMDNRVSVLELGADDYICKPFDLKEVIARVHVQLRRHKKENRIEEIQYKGLILHKSTYQVSTEYKSISLTKHEFAILELLMASPKQVFTKQQIYENVWKENFYGDDRTINTHISNIRGKLKTISDKEYIQTVWGIGFKLCE